MGLVYAEIQLTNGDDLALVRKGLLAKENAKQIKTTALVDSGAYMLTINEEVRSQLDLPVIDQEWAELADGSLMQVDVARPVEIRFENRRVNADAMVLPDAAEVLLGAIPMEGMDVLIDPKRQKLIVNPESPDRAKLSLKYLKPVKTPPTVVNRLDEILCEHNQIAEEGVRRIRLLDVTVNPNALLLGLPADKIKDLGLALLREYVTSQGRPERVFQDAKILVGERVGTFQCLELPEGSPPVLGRIAMMMLGIEMEPQTQELKFLPEPYLRA
ncbi:MAG: aspartyl protease family protein [Acidobacteriota bacterium]